MHGKVMMVMLVVMLGLGGGSARAGDGEVSWRGSGGWGVGLPYAMLYDAATVREVTGEVVRVVRSAPLHGMAEGVVVTLRQRDEAVTVQLGPLWFLERQDALLLPVGETISVRGSQVLCNGTAVLMASELRRKGRILRLRDEQGLPVWSAWRQQ